jgi:branched-chain amino acid transport system ATP-binding protein
MLHINDLSFRIEGRPILDCATAAIPEGRKVGLVGRNGAGKTTLLKAVMGLVPASRGSIRFDGVEIAGLPAHEIPRRGIGYVPQGRRLFGELSVAENLAVGRYLDRIKRAGLDRILAVFPVLAERMDQRAGSLSGGEQQMLAIARALCLSPRLLLVDEPTEGLMPRMVATIAETIAGLAAAGVGVLLVEQRIDVALRLADRVAILVNGRLEVMLPAAEVHREVSLIHRHVGLG